MKTFIITFSICLTLTAALMIGYGNAIIEAQAVAYKPVAHSQLKVNGLTLQEAMVQEFGPAPSK